MHQKYTNLALSIVLALWIVIAILVLQSGCLRIERRYIFAQSFGNVIKVEVCQYHYDPNPREQSVTPLAELDLNTAESMLNEFSATTCYRYFGDATQDYGEIVLYISYSNGEAEVLGRLNSARVDADGKWHIRGEYFDDEQWYGVLEKYIDSELMAEIEKYRK